MEVSTVKLSPRNGLSELVEWIGENVRILIINPGSKESNKHSLLNYCPRNNLSTAVEKVGEMPAITTPHILH